MTTAPDGRQRQVTDRDRLLDFLTEMEPRYPYERVDRDDVMVLPMDPAEVNFVRYATKISTDFFVAYFDRDGKFAGMARPGSWADA